MPQRKQRMRAQTLGSYTPRRRRRRRGWIGWCVAAVIAAAGYFVIQEFFIFTPEGIQFAFRDSPEGGNAYIGGAAVNAPGEEPRISIDKGELPPAGAGHFYGGELFVSGREAEDILSAAVNLKNLGYSEAVVVLKPADGAAATVEELARAAAACETVGLKYVAYISCFRDDVTAREVPELALFDTEERLFIDYNYSAWLNPYLEEVQAQVAALCRMAEESGAREIILDNFCFPYSGNTAIIEYSETDLSPGECITASIQALREALSVRLGVVLYGDDTLGEGASEEKGQDIAVFTALCDRIWVRAETNGDALSVQRRFAGFSQAAAEGFAAVVDGRYLSVTRLAE